MNKYGRTLESRQPCWECAKACNGGCSWSADFTPVEGWTAEETVDCSGATSYMILECPEFVKEDRENRERPELNTDGCLALIQRCLEVTRDDYLAAEEKSQAMIRKFIRGRGASRLHMIGDPEGVIRMLDHDAREYKKRRAQRLMVKGR